MKHMTLQLSAELYDKGAQLARDRDVTLGELLSDLLANEASRGDTDQSRIHSLDPLRARLMPDFNSAHGWADLQNRLREKGYSLHPAGDTAAVHRYPDGRHLCNINDLGVSYEGLVAQFRKPFSEHRLSWVNTRSTQAYTTGTGPDVPTTKDGGLCVTSFFASRRRRDSLGSSGQFRP